jgi:hypothetical protein
MHQPHGIHARRNDEIHVTDLGRLGGLLREAEEAMFARGLVGHEQEFLDSLHVMEVGMQHFFVKAMTAKANKGRPEIVDANILQAVSIAEKIAPYRHARLSAVKLAGEPNNPIRVFDNASADELRAEVMKHLCRLIDGGVIDLEALPVPNGGIANQPLRGIDQSGITGK